MASRQGLGAVQRRIQPGAILAILVLYWRTFRDVLVGMWRREASAFAFVRNLAVAFVPAVVLGLAIGNYVELLLGNAVVVAWALIIGGFAILAVERLARPTDCGGVANVTLNHSIGIGLIQCLAMIPGVIARARPSSGDGMGGRPQTAAEFSFFLAVPPLRRPALQLYKHGADAPADRQHPARSLVSFVVAVVW